MGKYHKGEYPTLTLLYTDEYNNAIDPPTTPAVSGLIVRADGTMLPWFSGMVAQVTLQTGTYFFRSPFPVLEEDATYVLLPGLSGLTNSIKLAHVFEGHSIDEAAAMTLDLARTLVSGYQKTTGPITVTCHIPTVEQLWYDDGKATWLSGVNCGDIISVPSGGSLYLILELIGPVDLSTITGLTGTFSFYCSELPDGGPYPIRVRVPVVSEPPLASGLSEVRAFAETVFAMNQGLMNIDFSSLFADLLTASVGHVDTITKIGLWLLNDPFSNAPLQSWAVGLSALTYGTAPTLSMVMEGGVTRPVLRADVGDPLLKRDWRDVDEEGTGLFSVMQALRFLRNRWTVVDGVLTVYREDLSTVAWTANLTSSAGASPVIGALPDLPS